MAAKCGIGLINKATLTSVLERVQRHAASWSRGKLVEPYNIIMDQIFRSLFKRTFMANFTNRIEFHKKEMLTNKVYRYALMDD